MPRLDGRRVDLRRLLRHQVVEGGQVRPELEAPVDEQAAQQVKVQQRETAAKEMDVVQVKNVRGAEISREVWERINRLGPDNQPYVGPAAFAHKGGVHVSAMQRNERTYEHVPPASVGNLRRVLISEMAGKSSLLAKLELNDQVYHLATFHGNQNSIAELSDGLAPELIDELHRINLPFTDDSTPSDAELRIAQAQLVGWLEGLFHGIQTAIAAQPKRIVTLGLAELDTAMACSRTGTASAYRPAS